MEQLSPVTVERAVEPAIGARPYGERRALFAALRRGEAEVDDSLGVRLGGQWLGRLVPDGTGSVAGAGRR
jgi:hypothetical protein